MSTISGVFVMIKEEYLNPEFMYKFINSCCRNAGWVLYDFSFGKLKYYGRLRPFVLKNGRWYNMVYNFKMYRMPENAAFPAKVREQDLDEIIEWRNAYFDISNEVVVEHDDNVASLVEFPKSFKLDNRIFGAVNRQPYVQQCHYSLARDCDNLKDYMNVMEIKAQNLIDMKSLFCNVVPKNRQELFPLNFCFKSGRVATVNVRKILHDDYDCGDFVRMERVWSAYRMHKQDNDFFRLRIHGENMPVFYTDNVTELDGGSVVTDTENKQRILALDAVPGVQKYFNGLKLKSGQR